MTAGPTRKQKQKRRRRAVFLLLLWRLAKKHRSTETICLLALTLYLFMENKLFLLSANPFLLLAPLVFFGSGEKMQEKE